MILDGLFFYFHYVGLVMVLSYWVRWHGTNYCCLCIYPAQLHGTGTFWQTDRPNKWDIELRGRNWEYHSKLINLPLTVSQASWSIFFLSFFCCISMSRRQAWSTGEKLAKLSQSNQALVADWLAGADILNKLLCDRPTDQWTKRWLLELRVLDFKIWIWPHDRLSDYHHWLFKSVQLSPTLMQIDAKGLINFICYRQFLVL